MLNDTTLSADGKTLQLHLVSAIYPFSAAIRSGTGEIELQFDAGLPPGGVSRRLTIDNHHQSSGLVYLVNTLVPTDKTIAIVAQDDANQSHYTVDFTQGPPADPAPNVHTLSGFAGAPPVLASGTSQKERTICSFCSRYYCLHHCSARGTAGVSVRAFLTACSRFFGSPRHTSRKNRGSWSAASTE